MITAFQQRRMLAGRTTTGALMFPGVQVLTWVRGPAGVWFLVSIEPEQT